MISTNVLCPITISASLSLSGITMIIGFSRYRTNICWTDHNFTESSLPLVKQSPTGWTDKRQQRFFNVTPVHSPAAVHTIRTNSLPSRRAHTCVRILSVCSDAVRFTGTSAHPERATRSTDLKRQRSLEDVQAYVRSRRLTDKTPANRAIEHQKLASERTKTSAEFSLSGGQRIADEKCL